MNVAALLGAATALLDDPTLETETVWPLGAAVLTRQAIETTSDIYWGRRAPAMREATRRQQWLALPSYLGRSPELAAAEWAWGALSDACHHRDYDVGLTAEELRSHLATAEAFRRLVGRRLHG